MEENVFVDVCNEERGLPEMSYWILLVRAATFRQLSASWEGDVVTFVKEASKSDFNDVIEEQDVFQ